MTPATPRTPARLRRVAALGGLAWLLGSAPADAQSWVPDTTTLESSVDVGRMVAWGFGPAGAAGGAGLTGWETPSTLVQLPEPPGSNVATWALAGDAWLASGHAPFCLAVDADGTVADASLLQEVAPWGLGDTLRLQARGGCACGPDVVLVGDLASSDSTRAAFALKWRLDPSGVPYVLDTGFGGGVDTLTFLGPDQSFEACATHGTRLAFAGWSLDACCVHKEVPVVRVVHAESGEALEGFGVAGTVALDLSLGTLNDSVGGLPVHESGGWFEDVVWTDNGTAFVAAGASLNGNAFQPLVAKFKLDGTLDTTFGEGGLSLPLLTPFQNHWLVSVDVLDDARLVGLLRSGTGEALSDTDSHLVVWEANGSSWEVWGLEWPGTFTPGHLAARGNHVALVGTVGDVVSLSGDRQLGVASWHGAGAWTGQGTTDSPYLLTGYDVGWAGDEVLHVSARCHSDSLSVTDAAWDDLSAAAMYRFVLQSAPAGHVEPAPPLPASMTSGTLFPNPSKSHANWVLPRPLDGYDIVDLQGRVQRSASLPPTPHMSLNGEGLTPGTYVVWGTLHGKRVARTTWVLQEP